jgi:signal transduction histidine kinase
MKKHLRLLFFAAVLVPCAVLAVLAVRAIDREEAFLEKRLQGALDVELTHAVSMMQDEIRRMGDELTTTAPAEAGSDPRAALAGWKKMSPLVGVPFLLSADFRILWPTRDSFLARSDLSFLNWNREFVTDLKPTPIFQNVALLYRDQIHEPPATLGKGGGAGEIDAKEKTAAPDSSTRGAAPVATPRLLSAPPAAKTQASENKAVQTALAKVSEIQQDQQALAEFEQNDAARKRVYDEAAKKGQKAETRTVSPGAGFQLKADAGANRPESIYISEPKRFSEVTAGREEGLIPRFIEDKLTLLFWKRQASGRIVGCVVEDAAAKSRLLGRLPAVYSPARILTVLDENGRPLVIPEGGSTRDWRRPLLAREVSEILPRWEAAAYPADPGALASQARGTRLLMGILIAGMFVVIAASGTVILNTLRSEMVLARQKTTFVTNVSHELKTPLTSIRMFSEMLKEGRQPDAEKQRTYLGLMVSETERLTRLINNVLDFSKMEKGKRTYSKMRLDAGLLAEAVVENERIRLEQAGFSVAFANAAGPAVVEADAEALRQALLNLLSNAEKYSLSIKSIDVEIRRTDGSIRIEVKDRGIGIPPAEAGKIFKEFYRLDRSLTARVPGSGLGLTIARRIARDLGGDIECLPRDGGGSVFRIILPEAKPR